MTRSETSGTGRVSPRLAALAVLLAVAVLGAACESLRDEIYFEDPVAELAVEGTLSREAVGGGTFYFANVRNFGTRDAYSCRATVTPLGAGNSPLGSFTAVVSAGYSSLNQESDDTLEPGEMGAFSMTVPVPTGMIVSERVTFSFLLEEEDD